MKKKFLSLFTAALMAASLLVVMPAASAGAEIASTSSGSGGSETVENIIYADFSVVTDTVTEEATTETDTSTDASSSSGSSAKTTTQPTDGYTAYLMFADSSWMWANFGPNGYRSGDPSENGQYSSGGYGQDALVTGDGTYTVSIVAPEAGSAGGDEYITGKITDSSYPENLQTIWDTDSQELEAAVWAIVFNVDILNLIDGTERYNSDTGAHEENIDTPKANGFYDSESAGPYKASAITISDVRIAVDGTEIAVDQSKLKCGNIESGNWNYRIEIYNEYGTTKDDPPINIEDIEAYESISVTFTISGLDSQNVDGIEPIPVTINTGKQKAPNELSVGIKSSTTNEAQTAEIAADGTVSLGNLPDGTYTLTFSAENCAPRSYTATVENGAIVEDIDVSLNLYGDVTGDGAANVKDMSKVYKNINKTELLSGYTKDVADITLDGKVNVKDYSKIYKHINKTALLW